MQDLPQRLVKYHKNRACSALLSKTNLLLQQPAEQGGCKGRLLPRQEGLKGPGIEIREAACAGERQISRGEVWRALGGSRGRGCQWDVVFSAQRCVDCCSLTASALCGSPVPPPSKSLMSVWRPRARPAKDTTRFLCPGDGL